MSHFDSMSSQFPSPHQEFILVCPAKAIEMVDGCVKRVTPASSVNALTNAVVDARSGLPRICKAVVHELDHCAIAIAQEPSSDVQFVACETQMVVLVGAISPESRNTLFALLPEEARPAHSVDDATLVGALYKHFQSLKHKYGFIGHMEGDFAFALYDETADSALAMRSPTGAQALFQGVDMKTGGLVITNALLTHGHEMSPIPSNNFIFGKFRERHLHSVPRVPLVEAPTTLPPRPPSSSNSKVLGIVDRILSGAASLPVPRGLGFSPVPSAATTPVPSGATTPSVKGTADKQSSWKRKDSRLGSTGSLTGLETAAYRSTPTRTHTATTTPSAKGTADAKNSWTKDSRAFSGLEASATTTPTHAATTTPSAKGTADAKNSWKKVSAVQFDVEETFYDAGELEVPTPSEVANTHAAAHLDPGSTVMLAMEELVQRTSMCEAVDGMVSLSFEADGSYQVRSSIQGRGSTDIRSSNQVRGSTDTSKVRRSVDLFGKLSRTTSGSGSSARGSLDDLANMLVERNSENSGAQRDGIQQRSVTSRTSLQVSSTQTGAQSTQALRRSINQNLNGAAATATSRSSLGKRLSGAF